MKAIAKITSVLIIFFVFGITKSYAQDPLHTLKVNPFAFFNGQIPKTAEYNLSLERALTNRMAIQVAGAYVTNDTENFNSFTNLSGASVDATGFRVAPALKLYLRNQESPRGMYIAPMYSYNRTNFINNANPNDKMTATYTSINLLGGWQMMFGKTLVLDFFGGVGKKNNSWDITNDAEIPSIFKPQGGADGMRLTFGLNAGIAF